MSERDLPPRSESGSRFIAGSAKLERGCKVKAKEIHVGENVVIERGVEISSNRLFVGDDTTIGRNSTIVGDDIKIGFDCNLEREFVFEGEKIELGDSCFIGFCTRFFVPTIVMGDRCIVHNHSLVTGNRSFIAGHNLWVGQNTILNSTGGLLIGNGVGIGAYSQIWSHGYFGELLEGCQIHKIAPTAIEDDVWLVGHCIVSPGVSIGRRSIVLVGSIVTKDIGPFKVFGGNPARDLTEKLTPYKEVTLEEKFRMMQTFASDFVESLGHDYDVNRLSNGYSLSSSEYRFDIIFSENGDAPHEDFSRDTVMVVKSYRGTELNDKVTIIDLETKKYSKKRSKAEIMFLDFLSTYRARFTPG